MTTTRNSSTYTERMNIPSHTNGYANSKVFYKNGNKAKTYEYVYDTPGNITKETLFLYGSDKGLKTEYAYDTNGRLKKVTNPLGLANEFSYNTEGRLRRIRMIHLVGRQVSRSLIILPLLYLTDGRRKGQTLCMP